MADEPFLLKNFFDHESVEALGAAILRADPAFDVSGFVAKVFDDQWERRELKQRMRHVAAVLHEVLDGDYRAKLGTLLDAVPFAADLGFVAMVLPDYVEAFGTDDWEASVPALGRFTTVASAEFAIRPFLATDRERTLTQMRKWARHADPTVRRLASEGSRPRLPWGMRLQALVDDPATIIPILDALRSDPDEAVRRSVANSLNDIAKDHPQVVIEVLQRWGQDPDEHLAALRRHALRTLLKRGDPQAMELLGFGSDAAVDLTAVAVDPPVVAIGGSAQLRFTITSTADELRPLMVDYAIHYVKADGSTSPKVFKLRTIELGPGESVALRRKLSFVQMTTRTHRPGTHRVEVQVNGTIIGGTDFELTTG